MVNEVNFCPRCGRYRWNVEDVNSGDAQLAQTLAHALRTVGSPAPRGLCRGCEAKVARQSEPEFRAYLGRVAEVVQSSKKPVQAEACNALGFSAKGFRNWLEAHGTDWPEFRSLAIALAGRDSRGGE